MINNILPLLSNVKQTAENEWSAICPVHIGSHRNFGIMIQSDKKIVMHCFKCGANGIDVCHALGLEPAILFPPKDDEYKPHSRVYFSPETALKTLGDDISYACLVIDSLLAGEIPSKSVMDKLETIHRRILTAQTFCFKPEKPRVSKRIIDEIGK